MYDPAGHQPKSVAFLPVVSIEDYRCRLYSVVCMHTRVSTFLPSIDGSGISTYCMLTFCEGVPMN